MMRMKVNRNGTAYVEYFLAAAAMAFATMAVWVSVHGNAFQGMRNGVMDTIQGPCTLSGSGSVAC